MQAQNTQSGRCWAPLSAAPGGTTRRASRDASPTSAWGNWATTRTEGGFCRLSRKLPAPHTPVALGPGCISSSFLLVEAASAMAQRSAATCVPTSFRGTEQLVTQKCVCFLKESRKTPGKGVCRELGQNSPCPRAQDHQITPTITYSPPITPMNAAFLHAQSLFTALTPF